MTNDTIRLLLLTIILAGCQIIPSTETPQPKLPAPQPLAVDVEVVEAKELYQQGSDFIEKKEFIPAYAKFRQAAEQGHVEAQFRVAGLY